jgi:hypothetical protein
VHFHVYIEVMSPFFGHSFAHDLGGNMPVFAGMDDQKLFVRDFDVTKNLGR